MSARLPQWLFGTVLLLLGHSAFAQTPCNASASWFTNPSFPTEIADNGQTDCVFHQFAWQAFIDVVQARPSGLREFESWMPDYGIFVPAGTPVTPWGQQPNAPCSTNALADAKNAKKLFLRPRVPKGPGAPSDDQATGDPLYDQQKQVVYYSIWVNKTEYTFITECDFNNTTCITSAPATTALPAGSVELKAAWRVFTGAPPTDMYTIQGVVGDTCQPVTMGLVGFHLVANTPDHPEFIWATFEHNRNAPDCTNPQTPPAAGWSFNNPSCNTTNCPPNQNKVNPTQVCRVAPQGGGSTDNTSAIVALNASVQSTLQGLIKSSPGKYDNMAIWLNYQMTGNVWTRDGALPPNSGNIAGSVENANTTLETFIQGGNHNCFTCHTQTQFVSSTKGPMGFPTGAPANFSHLWGFAQQTGGCGNGKGPLPAACPVKTSTSAVKKATESAKEAVKKQVEKKK
ncbi:MAG: hypothetical protein J0H86_13305 [Xanthomonadaceae bacterium]|nr:hypothetical protein [Xanthomonadaceae bacterium]